MSPSCKTTGPQWTPVWVGGRPLADACSVASNDALTAASGSGKTTWLQPFLSEPSSGSGNHLGGLIADHPGEMTVVWPEGVGRSGRAVGEPTPGCRRHGLVGGAVPIPGLG